MSNASGQSLAIEDEGRDGGVRLLSESDPEVVAV
jgi:hypothetical protein